MMISWRILILILPLIFVSCSRKINRKLMNSSSNKQVGSSTPFKKYIQNAPFFTDTIKGYDAAYFLLRLQNNLKKDVQLVSINSSSNICFGLYTSTPLPISLPVDAYEMCIPIKMKLDCGNGWYEGTAHFTFSDGTVDSISCKIYAQWPASRAEKGIIRLFKEFPPEVKKDRIFIERREIKAEVKFMAQYWVTINYINYSKDTVFISGIDYNKDVISWQGTPPQVIPPQTASALLVMFELGTYKEFDETIKFSFRNRPPETVNIKLLVDYLEDQIVTRLDTSCAAPLFGGKSSEYQSEIAFDQYVEKHIDVVFFEAHRVFGSGCTFVFYFTVNSAGKITEITCEPNKFPDIEKSLKDILVKSPPWAPSKCIHKKGKRQVMKNVPSRYKYRISFPEPMSPTTGW